MSVPHTHQPGAELAQVHVHTDGAVPVVHQQPAGVAVSSQPATVVGVQPVTTYAHEQQHPHMQPQAGVPAVAPATVPHTGAHTVVTAQAAATVPVKRPNTPVFAYIATFLMTVACGLFFIATTSDQMVSLPVVNNLAGYSTTGATAVTRTVTAYGVSEGLWRVCYESAVAYPALPVPLGPSCARISDRDCESVFETNSQGTLPNNVPYNLPYTIGACSKVNAVRAFCILAVIWSVAAVFSMAYNVWNAMHHDPYHQEAHNAAHGTHNTAGTATRQDRGAVQTDPGVAHPARAKEEVSRGSRAAGILALLAALMGLIAFAIAYDHYIRGYPVKLIGHSLMALIVGWPLAMLAFIMWIIPTPHVDWNELWVSRFGSLLAVVACALFIISVATRRFVYYTETATNTVGQVLYQKTTIGLWNSCSETYNLAANLFSTACTEIDNDCSTTGLFSARRCALLQTIRAFIIIAAVFALISAICKILSRAGHRDHYDERHNLKNARGVPTTGVHVPHTEPHATGVAPAAGADRTAPSVGQPANANTVDARHPNGDTHEVDDRAVALALLFGLLSAAFGFAAMAIACHYYAQPATNWGYSFYLLVVAWNLMLASTALVAWARYHHRIPDSTVTAIATATATPRGTQSVPTIVYPTNTTTDGSQVGVYYPLWSDRLVRLLSMIALIFFITAISSPDWVYVRERALHRDQYYNAGSQYAVNRRSTQYGLWRVCFNIDQCASISSDRDCGIETLVSSGVLTPLRDCRMYNGFRAAAVLTTLLTLCFVICQWITYCIHSRKQHHRNMGSNIVRYFGVFFAVLAFVWGIITIALCHRYFDALPSEYALSFWLFLTAWLIVFFVHIAWARPFVHHRAWSRSLQALLTLLALICFILAVAYPSFARHDYDSSFGTVGGNTFVLPAWYSVGRENDLGRNANTGALSSNSTNPLASVFVPFANGTESTTTYAALLAAPGFTNSRTTVAHGLFYTCLHNFDSRTCRWLNNDCRTRLGDVTLPNCDTFNVTRAFAIMALIMAGVSLLLRFCNLCAKNHGPHAFAGIANFVSFLFALVAVAAGLHWIRNSLQWSSYHIGPAAVLLIVGFLLQMRLVLAWWREPKWHKMHKPNDPSVTSDDFLDRDGAFLC